MKPKTIEVTGVVEHKHEGLPRFVCVPLEEFAAWKLNETTTVEGTMRRAGKGAEAEVTAGGANAAEVEIGRRSLKRWDDRGCWWMDLPEALCRKARVETGDRVALSLRLASTELPPELATLIATDAVAKQNWERLTDAQQRMLREEVYVASQSATRERRARRGLLNSGQ